jgi:hypothetical protein
MKIIPVKLLSVLILATLNISLAGQSFAPSERKIVMIPDSCKPVVKSDTTFYPESYKESLAGKSEEIPQFPGGDKALDEFIKKNTVYPSTALRDSARGSVYLTYNVGAGGCPTEFEILQGLNNDLKNESMRVAMLIPKYIPGKRLRKSPKGWYWANSVSTYILIFNFQLKPIQGMRGILILPPK